MIKDKRVVVVMPAYNAEKTLEASYRELDLTLVDDVVLVDDSSTDRTAQLAKKLSIKTHIHPTNLGYGGNQKTCYRVALDLGADIVIMLHPDYQYSPKLVPAMAHMIASGHYDCVLGSRILGKGALSGGMPIYKYVANRFLTFFQNLLIREKMSEYHSGFRAFSRKILEELPLEECQNDFIFDNEMLSQIFFYNFRVGEVSCPTKYFPEASSINFLRSVKYGWGVCKVSLLFFLCRRGLRDHALFSKQGRRLKEHTKENIFAAS